MSKTKRVSAISTAADTTYRMLNMIHVMAGGLANAKTDGWRLARTATYSDYVLTVWTNGIVEVGAETTTNGYDEKEHYYWMAPVSPDEHDDRTTHEDLNDMRQEAGHEDHQ